MDREVNLSEDTLLLCHAAGPGTCRVVFSLAPHGCKAQPRTALAKLAPTSTAAASEVALVAPGHVSGLASALQLVGVLETTCRRSSHSKATASKGWHWQLRPTRPSPPSGSQMRGWRWRPSDRSLRCFVNPFACTGPARSPGRKSQSRALRLSLLPLCSGEHLRCLEIWSISGPCASFGARQGASSCSPC